MDEVKKSDILQLPGFEAIEHPEMKKTSKPEIKKDEVIYKISNRDLNKISSFKAFDENDDAFFKKEDLEDFLKRNNFYEKNEYDIFEKYLQPDLIKIEIEPKSENDPIFKISLNDFFRITGQENKIEENGENEIKEIKESELNRILSEVTDTNKYRIDIEKKSKIVQVINKPKTLIYGEKDMNKFLDEDDKKRLIFYGLKFPDVRMGDFQKALETGIEEAKNIKSGFKSKVVYETNFITGLLEAKPSAKIRPNPKTVDAIKEYNTLIQFNDNMRKLREYKEKTGTGIIHFNNPKQLVKRLELLAGSIFAGNNGVKQEFTQIAHLLHQLKVINKKTLNDLLKKYILFE